MKLMLIAVLVVCAVLVNSVPLEVNDLQQILSEGERNPQRDVIEELREMLRELASDDDQEPDDEVDNESPLLHETKSSDEKQYERLLQNEAKELETVVEQVQEAVRSQFVRSNSSAENNYGGIYEGDDGLDWLFPTKGSRSNDENVKVPNQPEYRSASVGSRVAVYDTDTSNAIEERDHLEKRELENNIAVVKKGPYGLRPTYDPAGKDFSHADSKDMITGVKLYWFQHGDKKIFRQIGFKTSMEDYPAVAPGVDAGTNEELVLQKDEYITDIELSTSITVILYMKFTTNMGNSIEAGLNNSHKEVITSNSGDNKGALLYARGFQGYWLYEIEFTFFEHGVRSEGLSDFIVAMVHEIYNTLKTDVTKLGDEVYPKYQWMFPDVVARYCFDYKLRQVEEAKRSCNAEFLINALNTLRMGVDVYINHQPRALKYSDFDTNKLLDLARDAKNIYSSMYQLQLTISESASVTAKLANQLGSYFSSMAAFDQGIADQDRSFIESRIADLNDVYEATKDEVFDRLGSILGVALVSQGAEYYQKGVQLAAEVGASANPFNVDPAGVIDRVNDLAETIGNLVEIQILLDSLEDYVDLLQHIKDQIDSNGQQEASQEMRRLATTYSTLTDDQRLSAAATFIQNYGSYAPAVGSEDLAFANALLKAVATKACELAGSVETAAGITIQTLEAGKQNCEYIFADIAKLTVIYEELYNFQFDLVAAFAAMVRADVAATAAEQISAVSNTIDLTDTCMSLMMIEMSYQAAAHARCVVLEYTMGGKRMADCEALIFTDNAVGNILAFTGASVPTSAESRDAYIPTSDQGDNTPFVNLQEFLAGGVFSLSLPRGRIAKDWLIKNKWLIQSELDSSPEDSYYVKAFEAYIPNIECDNGETIDITIEARTSKYTSLFTEEATPTYLRAKTLYTFKYNEHDLAICDDKEFFKTLAQDDNTTAPSAVELCMISRGQAAGDTPEVLPSLLSTWQLKLLKSSSSCDLVVKDDTWGPQLSVKLDLIVVKQTDLNECFPTNTRCPAGQRCVDDVLSYDCVDNAD